MNAGTLHFSALYPKGTLGSLLKIVSAKLNRSQSNFVVQPEIMKTAYIEKSSFGKSRFVVLVCLLISPEIVIGESQLFSTLFSTGYDRALRPNHDKEPLTIIGDLHVEAFGNIKEANMEYRVYGYFRQRWNDPRLAGKLNFTLVIKGSEIEKIWVPDSFCYNARESNMMMPHTEIHSQITLDPNGDVFYSKGVTILASCNMDLTNFPLDSQNCHLKFGSYGYTNKDIIFKWNKTSVSVEPNEMAQFQYIRNNVTSEVDQYVLGKYSSITVTFLFKRRVGFYLIQAYLPDMFVVALSWLVFWMDKTEMGDRMALGITTILTVMFLLSSMNNSMPRVSYAKALDWYLLVSFIFVFLSLIECMLVFILTKKDDEKQPLTKCKLTTAPLPRTESTGSESTTVIHTRGIVQLGVDGKLKIINQKERGKGQHIENEDKELSTKSFVFDERSSADTVDKASRVLFPTFFVIFNIVYWFTYAL